MGNKALSVTNEDLDRFRKLMRFFFIENLKDVMESSGQKVEKVKETLHDIDTHFWLEEPLIAAQIGMSQHDADTATLVVSEPLFEAYRNFALYDIQGSYKPITGSVEEDKLIVDTALVIQRRLVEVLDTAVEMYSPEEQIVLPTTSKQFLN